MSMERSDHHCHARGCTVKVPPKMFMCRKHWFSLPKAMRDRVWATYTPGQENGSAMIQDDYFRATDEAIKWIAVKEAKP